MSTRFSARTKAGWLAVLLGACLAPAVARADKREDLYNQAVKAGSAGQIDEAARLFCEVARLDSGYKDSKQMCTLMTQEAERERKRNDDRFTEGVKAFSEGRFDDAEQKFRNVRGGSHADEAKQYLARLPAARAEKSSAEAESAKFDQALQAYQRNDFAGAKSLLGQIAGSRRSEAQAYLANIARYEQAMAAGDNFAGGNNPRQALNSYNDALQVKQDGPGDPRGKALRMQALLSVPSPGPTTTSTRAPVGATGGSRAATETAAAVKPSASQVDIPKLLREAEAATAKGQTGLASGKYLAILAAEPGNAGARRALDALSAQNQSAKQSAGSEADAMLAKALREFYNGRYDEAEVHIKDYLDANGSKAGLSHFYLGASKLTRYYLAAPGEEQKLLADAQAAFRLAKQAPGFEPPGENVISPRILAAYKETR